MNILVFALAPLWSPHFETELELVAKHESAGDEVVVVTCTGVLQSCIANPYHRRLDCVECRSKCRRGLDAISFEDSRRINVLALSDSEVDGQGSYPEFRSIEQLKAFKIDGAPAGRAAASSLISILRETDPSMSEHRELVVRILASWSQVVSSASRAIGHHRPDLVYVFNGRFATTAAVVEVCKRSNVRFVTHDASYTIGQYRLVESETVNDLDVAKRDIDRLWAEAQVDEPVLVERAKEFFEHRRYGGKRAGPDHLRFTSSQIAGHLPENLGSDYVAVLNSSEDEFMALTAYDNPVYSDQIAAIEAVLSDPRLKDTCFVLRAHPNLAGLDNRQTRHMTTLTDVPNLKVIHSEDKVDTYALIDRAASVVTFGSTTGIEAVYWGRPSILIGRAPFEDLGPSRPQRHDEVVELILRPPEPVPIEGALRYGYFMIAGGLGYEYYAQSTYFHGLVNGTQVKANWLARNARRLRDRFWLRGST